MVEVPTKAEFDLLVARVDMLEEVIAQLKLAVKAIHEYFYPPT